MSAKRTSTGDVTNQKSGISQIGFEQIVETALEGIWVLDENHITTYVNPQLTRILGYSADEMIGRKLTDFIYQEDFVDLNEKMSARVKGVDDTYERKYVCKDGTVCTAIISTKSIMGSEGKFLGSFAFVTDISKRKEMELKLRLSEERFHSLFNSIDEGVAINELVFDKNGDVIDYIILDVNPAFETHSLFKEEQVLGKRATEIYQMSPEYIRDWWRDHTSFKKPAHTEFYSEPTHRWFSVTTTQPENDRFATIFVDITKQKMRDLEILAEKVKLETALLSINDAIFISDVNGRFINYNDAFATFHKFESGHEMAKVLDEYPDFIEVFTIDGDPLPLEMWAVPRALRGETGTNVEYSLRRKDTGETWIGSYSFAPMRDEEGSIIGSVVVARDITEQKMFQNQMEESESKYRNLFKFMEEGVFYQQADGQLVDVNDAALRMFGLTRDEFLGRTSRHPDWKVINEDGTLLQPEQHPSMVVLATGKPVKDRVVGVYNPLNDTYTWLVVNGTPQFKQGEKEPYQVFLTMHDITDLRSAQRELHDISERNRALLVSIPDIIMEVDVNKVYTWANDTGRAFFGEDVIGREADEFFIGEQETYKLAQPLFDGSDQVVYIESWQKRVDGESRLLAWWCRSIKDKNGKVLGTLSTARDITESKKNEQMLRLQETAMEAAANAIIITDAAGSIQWVNQAWIRLTGYSKQEVMGKTPRILKSGKHEDSFYKDLWNTISSGRVWHSEIVNKRKDGSFYDEDETITPIVDDGVVTHFIGIKQDISEQKHFQRELIESENQFRTLFEQAAVGVSLLDSVSGQYIRINQKYCDFLGYSMEEMLSKTFTDVTLPGDKGENVNQNELLVKGRIKKFSMEKRYIRKDGQVVWGNLTASPLWLPDEKPEHFIHIAIVEDITERKRIEEEIRRNNEDLTLVSEINNAANRNAEFSVITSLISERAKEMFNSLGVSLHLVNKDRTRLVMQNINLPGPLMRRIEKMAGISLTQIEHDMQAAHPYRQVLESGEPLLINDLDDLVTFTKGYLLTQDWSEKTRSRIAKLIPSIMKLTGRQSVMVVPLLSQDKVIGTLDVGGVEPFTQEDLDRFIHIADQFSIIIQRKQAEEALRESENQLRDVLDATPFPVALVDSQDNNIRLWSRSALELFGHTAPTAEEWYQLAYPDPQYRKEVIETWKKYLQEAEQTGKTTNTGEYRVTCRDGSVRICELYVTFLSEGFIVTFNDITKRKQSQQALLASEEKFRTLFEQAASGVALVDTKNGQFLQINRKYCDMLGYSVEEMLQKTIWDVNTPEGAQKNIELNKKLLSGEIKEFSVEKQLLTKSGDLLWVQLTASPLWKTGQEPDRYIHIAIVQDVTTQKELEKVLRESEERYHSLFEGAAVGIGVFSVEGVAIDFNSKALFYMGGKLEDYRGKSLFDMYGKEEGEKYRQRLNEVVTSGKVKNYFDTTEFREKVWVFNSYYSPIRDVQGGVIAVQIISVDITQQELSRQELKKSEDRFKMLFEKAPVGYQSLNEDGKFIEINDTWLEMTGYKREEVIGHWFGEFLAPDYKDKFFENFPKFKDQGNIKVEFEMVKKDGSHFQIEFEGRIGRDSLGQFKQTHCILMDVTERRKYEDKLLRLNADLQQEMNIFNAYLENSPVYMFFKDQNIRSLRLSRNYEQMLGRPLDELLGKNMAELFPSEVAEKMVEDDRRILNEGRILEVEETLGDRQYTTIKFPIEVEGKPAYLAGFTIDITDRKKAEQELERLNAELEERVAQRTAQLQAKNRELETFTYTVSHDLKAPLRGISGYSTLLKEEYYDKISEEGRAYLNNLSFSAEKMGQLIEDLLQYSRLERKALQYEKVQVEKMIRDVVSDYSEEIKSRKIDLVYDLAPCTFETDKEALNHILRNLVDNAIKFTQKTEAPELGFSIRCDEKRCIIIVKDNGIGFDMKYHDKIYQIFQRLNLSEDFPGTGVGLALVKKSAERLNAKVWAESEVGKGASFFVEIPLE